MALGLILYDCIYLIVAAALYGGAVWATLEAAAVLMAWLPLVLAYLLAIPVGLVTLVGGVALGGLLLPRVRPGRYPMMKGVVFYAWLFRSMLRRALLYPPLKALLFTSNVLRFLTLRALGARVAFSASMSADVDLLDPWLTTVGPGAMIGARCLVSGHYVKGGELILAEVEVGPGALLAADVAIGPGVRVGRDCQVLGRATLAPGAQVGDGAVVGACAYLEPGVEVAPRARVGANAHLRRDQADATDASSASSTTSSAAPAV